MDESTSREKVLKNVRNAGIYQAECPYTDIDFTSNVFKESGESLDITFAEAFTKIAGKFMYCENRKDFLETFRILAINQNWNKLYCFEDNVKQLISDSGVLFYDDRSTLTEAKQGVTSCKYLIARWGSIMVSSAQAWGRRFIVYPDVHIVVVYTPQLLPDLPEALTAIMNKYGKDLPSLISVISGPSRTADIEKTLVMGAHGPRELYLFMIDDTSPV
jgi:L-lactate dehydrogenase complex protein LldG